MPDNSLSCSLSNPDYQRQLAEQAAAEQSDLTCHDNQCEAPPAKSAAPACRDKRSVETEARAADHKPTQASSQLARKASAKRQAHRATAHSAKKRAASKPTDTNAERTEARRPGPYAAHVGVRDPDHDGRQDVCVGGGAGGVEASLCLPNLIRW